MNITSMCHNSKLTHPAHRHLRGDGDELVVLFDSSLLSFETATKILLSNSYCTLNPL